ncbi:MAG: type II secretion system major pseudopilin GspG [Nitrospirae bacterium]|nr:type II secretion system major pseudopilin GspG [Nitrospirota bacterium]
MDNKINNPKSRDSVHLLRITHYASRITHHGFTLIELMVVMIILGLLAAIVVPKFIGKVGPAKQKAAQAQIELLGTALDSFHLDVGRYPTTAEGLQALITRPAGADDWKGPYLKKQEIPLDPWGNPYHYDSPGSRGEYDLYSYGADNSEGGSDENTDITSWQALK